MDRDWPENSSHHHHNPKDCILFGNYCHPAVVENGDKKLI
jgi:hypothetical protein